MIYSRLLISGALAFICGAAAHLDDADAIRRAKAVSAAHLDSSLPSQRLDEWLHKGPPKLERVSWAAQACPGDAGTSNSSIRCVRVAFARDGVSGAGLLRVPLLLDGRAMAVPQLLFVHVTSQDKTVLKLSDLPRFISERASVVLYAKSIDVRVLDDSLPSGRLDAWLRSSPVKLGEITWPISDCDIKPDDNDVPPPLCVRFAFAQRGVTGYGMITVGVNHGRFGTPKLSYAVVSKGLGKNMQIETVSKLSMLPAAVAKFSP